MGFAVEDSVLFYAVLPHTLQFGVVAEVKPAAPKATAAAPKPVEKKEEKKEEVKPAPVEEKNDDEVDLFGDDEDDEAYEAELERRKQEALAAKGTHLCHIF